MELTLRPRRFKYLLFALLSAGFALVGATMVRDGEGLGWAEILFFGTGAIVFCLLLLPGSAYLKLDPAGFTFCSLFRPHFTPWSEVEPFAVGRVGTRLLVVFNFSEAHRGQKYLRKVSSAISGYEAALPDTYRLKAADLAALMNDWRQRCAPSVVPGSAARIESTEQS
jgi:hypothetical protein